MIYAQYNRLNVPVWATTRRVVKRAYKLLAKKTRYKRKYREQRHAWLRAILAEHKKARELYGQVMRGSPALES